MKTGQSTDRRALSLSLIYKVPSGMECVLPTVCQGICSTPSYGYEKLIHR